MLASDDVPFGYHDDDLEPSGLRPVDLPDLRVLLWDRWKPGGLYADIALAMPTGSGLASLARFDADTLADAELFWLSESTCQTITAAQETYPADTVLDETFLPAPCGLAVFAVPFVGVDAENPGMPVRVDAICWGPVTLRSRRSGELRDGIAITSYAWGAGEGNPTMLPLGRADWLFGRRMDAQSFDDDPLPESNLTSAVEDRRVLATLCSLTSNPAMIDRGEERGDRALRRRSTRAGIDADRVRVHTLRLSGEHRSDGGDGDGDGDDGGWYRHRFVVRGHWRQARVGPRFRELASGEREPIRAEDRPTRPVWVAAHIKGPAGADLLDPGAKVHRVDTGRC